MRGQPVLLHRGKYRQQFADFLDRVASGTAHKEEWSSFVVTHYRDEFLEEMRRCTVRLGGGFLAQSIDSDEGRQMLRAWPSLSGRPCEKTRNSLKAFQVKWQP